MRRTKEDAELTRQRLLQAGYEMILEKGYERMTRDEIAARAGMSRGAVNWHFKTKEEIYIAILTSFLDYLALRRQEIYRSSERSALDRLIALYMIPLEERDKFNFVNQIPVYLLNQAHFQGIQQRMVNNKQEFVKYLHTCLDELEAGKIMPSSRDRESLTALLFFLYEGIHSPGPNVALSDGIDANSIAQYLQYVLFSQPE